jgi:transposase
MSFIRKLKRGNKFYFAEVATCRVKGKVVQRHIRYIGRAADDDKKLATPLSDLAVEHVKLYGPLLVLDHIAREIRLNEVLGPFGREVLSLVYAHCLDYKSVNKMERWFQRTDLNMLLGLDELTEARLLKAMDSLEQLDQIAVQRTLFRNARERYNLGNRGVIYDVTNTYFCGKQCRLGKYGKDKEGIKGRPLIQIGLGVTRNDGIPVFHQVYDGNVHDSRMFQDAVTTFRLFGINDVLVVFDRGISSKKNQLSLKQLKLKVLCGLPLNDALKKTLRSVRNRDEIVQLKNRVPLNDSVFYVHVIPHSIGGVKGRLAFCINDRRRFEAKEARYRDITEAQSLLRRRKPIKESIKRFLGKDGRILAQRVTAAEEFDGCSCIFTTAPRMSKEEMVAKYFDKDLVEKAFHDFKGVIKLRPVRHWLENRVRAHVFICYLSYLLLTLLNKHVKKLGMTATSALEELDSLYKVYLKDKNRSFKAAHVVALTRKQEEILRVIDKRLLKICV